MNEKNLSDKWIKGKFGGKGKKGEEMFKNIDKAKETKINLIERKKQRGYAFFENSCKILGDFK